MQLTRCDLCAKETTPQNSYNLTITQEVGWSRKETDTIIEICETCAKNITKNIEQQTKKIKEMKK